MAVKLPNREKFIFLASGILIGTSIVFLTQASYTVQTNIDNAVQVIQKIILQTSGGATGSVLDGDTINTVNMEATQYCDEAGTNCVDSANIFDSESEVDSAVANNGYITGYTETDPVFTANMGNYYTTGVSDTKYLTSNIHQEINITREIGGSSNLILQGDTSSSGSPKILFLDTSGSSSEGVLSYLSGLFSMETRSLEIYKEGYSNISFDHDLGDAESDISLSQEGDLKALIRLNSDDDGGTLEFHNRAGGVKETRLYINGTGDIGIGTSLPQTKLDINGGVRIGNTSDTAAGTIKFSGDNHFYGYDGTSRIQLDN